MRSIFEMGSAVVLLRKKRKKQSIRTAFSFRGGYLFYFIQNGVLFNNGRMPAANFGDGAAGGK